MASPPTGFLAGKSVWQVRQPVFGQKNPCGSSAKRFFERFFGRKIRMGGPPRGFLAEKSVWEVRQVVFCLKNLYGRSAKWFSGPENPYGGPANRFYRAYSLMKYLERNSQFSWMIAFPRSWLVRLLVCASASMPFSIISFSI